MRMRCPHCLGTVEIVDDRQWFEVTCPSCGSNISFSPQEETASSTAPRQKIGHFELIRAIGTGHFGMVWRARDTVLERDVAIKIARFDEAAQTRWSFLQEARAASQLQHPAIVPVYEIGKFEGRTYIVSQLIDGQNLRARVKREGALPPREAAAIVRDIARALAHAHQAGVLHRDIKSANILQDQEGNVYLTDFGLAKREEVDVTVTKEGDVIGTPAYMSPEQASGNALRMDERSDVYSLGAVLFELLTAHLPFSGGDGRLADRIQYEPAPSPRSIQPGIPRDLAAICLKCLEKRPEDRYATAEDLAADLDRFLRHESVEANPPSRFRYVAYWCRREPAKVVAVATSLLLLLTLGLASWVAAQWSGRIDPASLLPWATEKVRVVIPTEPAGAELHLIPLDPETFQPRPEYRIGPLDARRPHTLPSGWYLVVARTSDTHFHEVFRKIPRPGSRVPTMVRPLAFRYENGVYTMRPITLFHQADVTAGMARIPSQKVSLDLAGAPTVSVRVPAFFVSPSEIRVADLLARGVPLPFHLAGAGDKPADRQAPVTGLTLWGAASLAEQLGGRLPSAYHYAVLVRHLRDTPSQSSKPDDADGPAVLVGSHVIREIVSGKAEWTMSVVPANEAARGRSSPVFEGTRLVWAATVANAPLARSFVATPATSFTPRVGLRLVRSLKPRLRPEDFCMRVGNTAP